MTKVPIRIINKSVEVEVDGRGRGGRGGMGVQRCNSGMITPPLKNHSLPPTPTSLNEHFLKASTSFEDLIHSGINGIKSSIFSSPLPKTNGDSNVSKPPNHLLTGLKELKKYFLLSKSLLSSLSPLKRNSLLLLGVPLLAIPAIWFISFIPLMFCIFAILYSYKFGTIHLIMDIKECIPKNNLISKISFSYLLPSIDFLIINLISLSDRIKRYNMDDDISIITQDNNNQNLKDNNNNNNCDCDCNDLCNTKYGVEDFDQ